MSLLEHLNTKALELGVPLSVQLDLTWRCNERCMHCYLYGQSDPRNRGELTTDEIRNVLRQLADAGVFFLTFSGGEPFLRPDCFEILEHARALRFNVKLKTNAVLIGLAEAEALRRLAIEQIQVSIYSYRDEIHDSITNLPGSLQRSLEAIRLLKAQELKVSITDVLMAQNFGDVAGVQDLAQQLGAAFTIDPTITPMLNGDRSNLNLCISSKELEELFRSEKLVGNVDEFCAPPPPVDGNTVDGCTCSAGQTACYVSPYGDVFPCIQFPVVCGNLREHSFKEIWRQSARLYEIRSTRTRDLPTCSRCAHAVSCTRCPGLAYMEGDMRGVSSADCEKSFARTGILPAP